MQDLITVRGARVHNLKNLDVDLPRDRLVVLTGVSGSGKSSLAFDTIYAEGQRRYVESLSSYARQFLGQMEKPDVDHIDGLSPALSIEQRTSGRNPRSTVGTVTEIYDYLRVLWARAGTAHCPQCGRVVESLSTDRIVERALAHPDGTRLSVLAPVVRRRKGAHKELLQELSRRGFTRVRLDGAQHLLADAPPLKATAAHDVEIVVDRIVLKPGVRARLADSVETALREAGGLVVFDFDGRAETCSTRLACPDCGTGLPELHPRIFSFNSPSGACPECGGLGRRLEMDPDRILPDRSKSLREGALATLKSTEGWSMSMFEGLGRELGFTLDTPLERWSDKAIKALLYGYDKPIEVRHEGHARRVEMRSEWEGVVPGLERRLRETKSEGIREWMQQFMDEHECRACGGRRLRPESLAVEVDGLAIDHLTGKSVVAAREAVAKLSFTGEKGAVVERLRGEIVQRLGFLANVGLDYLTLDRPAATLSGGEAQRIRLATQIGASLRGVLYVLDEPTVGLHPHDTARLVDTLVALKDRGNTVLVVEHDPLVMRAADQIVDLGPGAGEHGGRLVAQGTWDEILRHPQSLTGRYLRGEARVSEPHPPRRGHGTALTVLGAGEHNLRGLDVEFPLGKLVVVTGVSGSGKSTLVNDVLAEALAARLGRAGHVPGRHKGLRGTEHVDRLVIVDQSPIGRSPNSNPATYVGAFTPIRELFAQLPDSRARGWGANRFSFNVPGGRCEDCAGDGVRCVEMHFLPDLYVPCETCGGTRYNRETLQVRYAGLNVAEVLDLTAEAALRFFHAVPALHALFATLVSVGLGYLKLGQPATTLSGGEAQRVKLSAELARGATGRTLYVLDEPTTGLHFEDVRRLLGVLDRLVDAGNTVLVIEHNLDVVRAADHVVDLGPGGGDNGGRLVFAGTPADLERCEASLTGRALRAMREG